MIPVGQLHPQSLALIVPLIVPLFWQGAPLAPVVQGRIV